MCPIHTHTHTRRDQVMVFSPLGRREASEGGRAKGWESGRSWRIECEALQKLANLPLVFSQPIIRVITCIGASLRPSMSVAAIRWWRRAQWWCTWPPLVSWWRWRPTNRISLAQGAGRAERFGRFGCSVFLFRSAMRCGFRGRFEQEMQWKRGWREMMVPIPHLRRGRDDVSYPRCPVSFPTWVLGSGFWV